MSSDLGLLVQELPDYNQRVLVVLALAELRASDGWASTNTILDLFEGLRVPPPSNVNTYLGRLSNRALVIRKREGGVWSLTPSGKMRATEALGNIAQADFSMNEGPQGSIFADTFHMVIPPALAPPKWAVGIQRLLETYPFESNVFLMTRYPSDDTYEAWDPIRDVINALRTTLQDHGLTLHLASDRQLDDDVWGNVVAHIWACRYGIGVLETRYSSEVKGNVLIELGSKLMTGRRTAILKDKGTPHVPSDLAGHIYKTVDLDDLDSISEETHRWIASDLGLGCCERCPADNR